MRWWTLRLDCLAASVDLCACSGCEFSGFGLGASHGGHAFLSGFADSNDGMTEYVLKSEDHLMDECVVHEPNLALPLRVFRSDDFA